MIQIEHLSVSYQRTLALEDLSITIQGPTILGILGPNGAGKSTLIKAMLGLLPHSGRVQLDQKDIGQVLQRVAYVEQKTAIGFPLPHHGAGVCLTGTLSPSLYLQEKNQGGFSKGGRCLGACQSP